MSNTDSPAEKLTGITLEGEWRVVSHVPKPDDATGGMFSQGYIAETEDGRRGFLKALDYKKAMTGAGDSVKMLQFMTAAFDYERSICLRCREGKLDRIVRAIVDGTVRVLPDDPWDVPYLIFELADGDIRKGLDEAERFENAWAVRTLHHVAVGLKQLHGIGVAHQDLKPSNVLLFSDTGAKLADLGRCFSNSIPSPHDSFDCCGDRSYAPPELRYRHITDGWENRRLGCDAYLLGSMIHFMFSRASMTGALLGILRPEHLPGHWSGTYQDVLPYLQASFEEILNSFGVDLPEKLRIDLLVMLRELCEPDPLLRGLRSPSAKAGGRFSLHQYVSRLHRLCTSIEIGVPGY